MSTSIASRLGRITAALAVPALALSAAVGLTAVSAAPAQADRSCSSTLKSITIRDNVQVPRGATCDMTGVRVNGNINLGPGSTLRFRGGTVTGNVQGTSSPGTISIFQSSVHGDVQAKNAQFVRNQSGSVGGNVQVEGSRQGVHLFTVAVKGDVQTKYTNTRLERNYIEGNVQHEEGTYLVMHHNRVRSDTQVFKNRHFQEIVSNTISGDLQCKENQAPRGWGNLVYGSKEDQCRRF